MGHAERSGDLRKFIEKGKKIIISTIQKFPFILDEIGNEQRGRAFAIIIDEAHSSQGGKSAGAMATALGEAGEVGEEETYEDQINRLMESRKLLANASYFAFTATPKNKTLEIFGDSDPQNDGTVRHLPGGSWRGAVPPQTPTSPTARHECRTCRVGEDPLQRGGACRVARQGAVRGADAVGSRSPLGWPGAHLDRGARRRRARAHPASRAHRE